MFWNAFELQCGCATAISSSLLSLMPSWGFNLVQMAVVDGGPKRKVYEHWSKKTPSYFCKKRRQWCVQKWIGSSHWETFFAINLESIFARFLVAVLVNLWWFRALLLRALLLYLLFLLISPNPRSRSSSWPLHCPIPSLWGGSWPFQRGHWQWFRLGYRGRFWQLRWRLSLSFLLGLNFLGLSCMLSWSLRRSRCWQLFCRIIAMNRLVIRKFIYRLKNHCPY